MIGFFFCMMIIPPYKVKSFFLEKQGIFGVIPLLNELEGWAFLRIWYENRGFGVHETERRHFALHGLL